MTRFIPYLVAITISLYPACGLCSYLIQLKNGAQILTNQYREEDGQIRFYYHGGIVGFYRDSVHEVIDSELPIEEKLEEPKAPPIPEPAEKKKTPPAKTDKASESEAVKKHKEEKKTLKKRYQKAKKRLYRAEKRRDPAAKEKAQRQMKRVIKKMSELTDKVKSENNGKIPNWW